MKKFYFILLFFGFSNLIFSQELENKDFKAKGNITGKVFWNYNYNFTEDVKKASSFEIKRSYFGYKYVIDEKFSVLISFDAGKGSEENSSYSAYLKKAKLEWKVASKVKLSLGIIGLKQFNDQEKLWGYRYIYKSFQDEHKFGSSADLGVNAEIKILKMLKMNIFILNGEGYKKIQDEFGTHRTGFNFIAEPIENLYFKFYYDLMPNKYDKFNNDSIIADTSTISNLSFFAGYKTKKIRIGMEYNIFKNGKKYSSPAENHNLYGLSAYFTYVINPKFEVFCRLDKLHSKTAEDEENHKNLNIGNEENNKNLSTEVDGMEIIGGLQYTPIKNVKISINYRNWIYEDEDAKNNPSLFLNFCYKF